LLSHLSLLFIPVGVGVMTHLNLLSTYGGRIAVVIVVSTWMGLAVTAWVLFRLTPESDSALKSDSGHG
jgi:holin-like protein